MLSSPFQTKRSIPDQKNFKLVININTFICYVSNFWFYLQLNYHTQVIYPIICFG